MGGSNGGLLVGNMLMQYPQLFARSSQVPLLDMKRYSHLLAGARGWPNTATRTRPTGTSSSPLAVPPVRQGHAVPAGAVHDLDQDDRVHPGHARKMMALMLENGKDVRYYENIEGGHGGAANNAQSAARTPSHTPSSGSN